MNMKSKFKTTILTLALFVTILMVMQNNASAESVFYYDGGHLSYYLNSEKIFYDEEKDPPYRVAVKVHRTEDGMYMNFFTFGFSIENDHVVGYVYNRSHGYWECLGEAREKPEMNALWQAMKPYMDEKGIYYDDTWQ